MTVNSMLGVAGVLLTIVAAGWTIWLARRQLYPGEITFVKDGCIGLFDSIVRNLPELSVLYKEEPIDENLVLLKGYFLNSGDKDISRQMVEENLQAVLPEDFRWLTARVIPTRSKVEAGILKDTDQVLTIDFGLFRRNEHIRFEAVAEVPSEEGDDHSRANVKPAQRLEGDLRFKHRIADTRAVSVKEMPRRSRRRLKRMLFVAVGYLIVVPVVVLIGMLTVGIPSNFIYEIPVNGRTLEVAATPHLDGTVEVAELDGGYEDGLSLEEFMALEPEMAIGPQITWAEGLKRYGVLVVIFAVMLLPFAWGSYREARLKKKLGLESEETGT